jgi:hypothetical protein
VGRRANPLPRPASGVSTAACPALTVPLETAPEPTERREAQSGTGHWGPGPRPLPSESSRRPCSRGAELHCHWRGDHQWQWVAGAVLGECVRDHRALSRRG